jgi:hypothetical protein
MTRVPLDIKAEQWFLRFFDESPVSFASSLGSEVVNLADGHLLEEQHSGKIQPGTAKWR